MRSQAEKCVMTGSHWIPNPIFDLVFHFQPIANPSSISRRVEVKCSWCKESIYKAPSDLIHYPSKQLKEYHFCNKDVCMANFYSKKKKGMPRQGNAVVCDGKEFLSYADLAREYGLETRLVNDRIRNQGLTPEQAVGINPRKQG